MTRTGGSWHLLAYRAICCLWNFGALSPLTLQLHAVSVNFILSPLTLVHLAGPTVAAASQSSRFRQRVTQACVLLQLLRKQHRQLANGIR